MQSFEQAERRVLARRLPAFGRAAAAIFQRSMRPGGAPREEWVFTDEQLAQLAVPTLFVWGAREPYGRVDVAHDAAAAMLDASVEAITDAWHHPWLADPRAVGQVVRNFLAARDA